MKKVISLLLAFTLIFSMSLGLSANVFAANALTYTAAFTPGEIEKSDNDQAVTVVISSTEEFSASSIGAQITLPTGWTLTELKNESVSSTSANRNLATGIFTWADSESNNHDGLTEVLTASFTIPGGTDAGNYDVEITSIAIAKDFSMVDVEANGSYTATLTITGEEPAPTPTYGANIAVNAETSANTVRVGDTIKVDLGAGSNYHATEMTVSYDSTLVTFDKEASTLGNATVTDKNGTIELADYGAEKTASTANYVLAFTAKSNGNAVFKITEAGFGSGTSAETANLTPATVSTEGITIAIDKQQFTVVLDDIYTSDVTSVEKGDDFTFRPETSIGAYYNYGDPTATYEGGASATVTKNDDGSWTVANVTGNLTITGTRTAKTYSVDITEDMTVSNDGDTATYGTDYHFVIKSNIAAGTEKGYTYKLDSVTIGDNAYTGYSNEGTSYTIPGGDIIGDIVISISVEEVDENKYNIIIGGEASGAVEGGNTITVDNTLNSATITLNSDNFKGYILDVEASEGVTVTDNDDGTWTLSGLTPDATIEITKTVDIAGATNAKTGEGNDYVQADNVALWLVQMPDNMENMTGDKKQNYFYDGEKMYWSERHNAYVITVFATEAPVIAPNMFTIETVDATPEIAADNYDVNQSGEVDANDAQLIWNMYNAWYEEFTTNVTQEKFILADANADSILNMEDATVIINKILNIVAGN